MGIRYQEGSLRGEGCPFWLASRYRGRYLVGILTRLCISPDKTVDNNLFATRSTFSRRSFLNRSLLATAGVAFVGCGDLAVDSPTTLNPGSILIVGAGMSGLVAGYELTRLGFKVTILEAASRIGGRVYTLRDPFSDGMFAEAGAARIPPDHNLTLHYANAFNLTLDPFYPTAGSYLNYVNARRTKVTVNDFLNDRPWPRSAIHGDYVKIRGGTDRLPLAFAEALHDKIILESPVSLIDQRSEQVTVRTSKGETYSADSVIVTVPLPVLNKIQFMPELSREKQEAANGKYRYASASRVYVQTRERFWESEGLNGYARTDWPEEIWQPTVDQPGDKGILLTYMFQGRAREVEALGASERIDHLVERWKNVFPGITDQVEQGTSHAWDAYEWSLGAFAGPTPSQSETYDAHLRRPEGKIHFAGEHISDYHGWMQGALQSGLRVVSEIQAQLAWV